MKIWKFVFSTLAPLMFAFASATAHATTTQALEAGSSCGDWLCQTNHNEVLV